MPGLIDMHWHAMLVRITPAAAMGDVGYNNIVAADEAADTPTWLPVTSTQSA